MWPSGFGDETSSASYAAAKIEYQFNSNVERLTAKKVSSGATIKGPFNWASVNDQYFAAVFLPENPNDATLITLHNSLDVPKDPKESPGHHQGGRARRRRWQSQRHHLPAPLRRP